MLRNYWLLMFGWCAQNKNNTQPIWKIKQSAELFPCQINITDYSIPQRKNVEIEYFKKSRGIAINRFVDNGKYQNSNWTKRINDLGFYIEKMSESYLIGRQQSSPSWGREDDEERRNNEHRWSSRRQNVGVASFTTFTCEKGRKSIKLKNFWNKIIKTITVSKKLTRREPNSEMNDGFLKEDKREEGGIWNKLLLPISVMLNIHSTGIEATVHVSATRCSIRPRPPTRWVNMKQ